MRRLPGQVVFGQLLLAALVSPHCGDTSGPVGAPGIRVVRGGGETDTVLTRLTQALVVGVNDSLGRPARGEIVRFEALPADSPSFAYSVFVARLAGTTFEGLAVDSTGSDGLASVLVQLGYVAGQGRLRVFVPRLGLVDTVEYTILVGAAAAIVALPLDTAVAIGTSYVMRARVLDAYGNVRSDPVTYGGGNSAATVSATGLVTGQVPGRATILATSGTRTDSAHVSVVPDGTIAATAYGYLGIYDGSIVTLRLDGSNLYVVPQSSGGNQYLSWMPSGTAILGFSLSGHVTATDLTGNMTLVVPAGTFPEDNWPSVSSDGAWVYFRGVGAVGGASDIYRIHPDGTGLDTIPTALSGNVTQPSPSPDGVHIAYTGGGPTGIELRTYNLSTGADSLVTLGYAAHWAPTGDLIAFHDNGVIKVVHPDGTGTRAVSSLAYYDWAMSWSPDGKWLVVSTGANLHIIEVATGLTLPLPYSNGLGQPAWKP